jgi:hypothetical protein
MSIPPSRQLIAEIAVGMLIFVGALAASLIVSVWLLFFFSAISGLLIPQAAFAVGLWFTAVFNWIGLLVNPVIFVSIAANHCRRVTLYFAALTPIYWLLQLGFFRWQHLRLRGEMPAALASAATGIGLAHWILRQKERRSEAKRASRQPAINQ